MKRIIINGANGYVASNFINELLIKNYEVIALVRESKKYSSYNRMNDALSDINDGDFIIPQNLKIFSYSLIDEDFSIEEPQLKEIFSEDVDYYHFAASLKYDLKSKDEIFKTNIDGVENSLNVFTKYAKGNSRFFFISTAYSCGKATGLFEEKFYDIEDISKFRNYYEQSKRYAENIIKKHIESDKINAHILRLSQVVGNNKSGVTKTDYGIFDFAKRINRLSHSHPNITVRVRVDPESTQNLIPIDTVVGYLIKTVEINKLPVVINLIAKHSVKNKHIIDSLCKLLPINIIADKNVAQSEMNSFERIISMGMSFTGSYVSTNLLFDTNNLDNVLSSDDSNEANEHTIFKMLNYFIGTLSEKKETNVMTQVF